MKSIRATCPTISIVFATHNRREAALRTVECVAECGLSRRECELIVVDNASTDGTADALEGRVDRLIRLQGNRGSTAKAHGADLARGEYLVFLDDDSHPLPGSLERMVAHFEKDPQLGAAGFRVHLPDGREEGGALPGAFVGCGVGFRASAYRAVGGLDRTFFMQAEEYDLGFRLAAEGWRVVVLDDLHVRHEKTPQARRNERTTYYDTRNNLRVVGRYIPTQYVPVLKEDYAQRYRWLAERNGHARAFEKGKRAGRRDPALRQEGFAKHRLDDKTFEYFFRFGEIERRMSELWDSGVRRVLLAGLGKNIYPFVRAAGVCGLEIAAICDDVFASPGRQYRAVPVAGMAGALALDFDAVVVSNAAPVHAGAMRDQIAAMTDALIHAWFARPSDEGPTPALNSPSGTKRLKAIATIATQSYPS